MKNTRFRPPSKEDTQSELSFQNLLSTPEVCTFLDFDIERLKSSNAFPAIAIFRPYDATAHSDCYSKEWVCFSEFPFTLGLSYPFPPLFSEFFATTSLSFSQVMPMVWRILLVIHKVNNSHSLNLGIPELAQIYNLRSHGSSRFLFQVKSGHSHLVLRATQNDPNWKGRFFFVRRDSIPNGNNLPTLWIKKGRI